MLLEEWDLDEAQEAWFEEGQEKGWELAEAKYQPVIAAKDQALTEKARENQAIKREIEELRRKLREAGVNSQQPPPKVVA